MASRSARGAWAIRRSTGDLFALAIPAGEALGRVGCYFNGCCHGQVCDLPFAVFQHDAWRHPTQLYSAASSALIFGVLWRARDKWPREGDGWKAFLVLWGAARFVIEARRAHDASASTGPISGAQWTCLGLIAVGCALLWRARRPRMTLGEAASAQAQS